MPIEFACSCGRVLRAPEHSAGRRGKCPACGSIFTVPSPALPMETEVEPFAVDDRAEIPIAPRAPIGYRPESQYIPEKRMTPAEAIPSPRRASALDSPVPGAKNRSYLYLLLLFALLPLGWSTVAAKTDEKFMDRLKLTYDHHPDWQERIDRVLESDSATKEMVFDALPSDKLDGAFLKKHTWAHWYLAALSGIVFIGLVLVLFPLGHAKVHQLVMLGIFTGTIGILLLLGLQYLAFHMPLFHGRGWITLLLDLVWLIGQSYKLALTDTGFVLSFLGFTAGVGFCEEACKAIPLIYGARRGYQSWRTAMLWGLISGVGFGVSEGITYSTDYYNGISGPQIYAVRFISCVCLHAIWAAAVGITIFRRQDDFRDQGHPMIYIWRTLQVVIVPMILHGLYDTLLKQKYDLYALGVAVASFGWLTWQIERAKREFDGVVA